MNNNFQFSIFNFQRRGFTLIETLVAVSIMTIAVAGPLYAASRAIVAAQNARDQLVASYLAQEGVEYVRAVRDDAYLIAYRAGDTSSAWTAFINTITATCSTSCQFEPADMSLNTCSGNGCSVLWLASTNVYTQQQTTGAATSFTRIIQATPATDKDEKIVSKVLWNFHGTQYSVTITDHLTPWQ